jgi:hypothetical protein
VNGRSTSEHIPASVRADLAGRFEEPNARLADLLRTNGLTVPGWLADQVPAPNDTGS